MISVVKKLKFLCIISLAQSLITVFKTRHQKAVFFSSYIQTFKWLTTTTSICGIMCIKSSGYYTTITYSLFFVCLFFAGLSGKLAVFSSQDVVK